MADAFRELANNIRLWHGENFEQLPAEVVYAMLIVGVHREDTDLISEATSLSASLFGHHPFLRDILRSDSNGFPAVFLLGDDWVPHWFANAVPDIECEGAKGEPPDYDVRKTASFIQLVSFPLPGLCYPKAAVDPGILGHFRFGLNPANRECPHCRGKGSTRPHYGLWQETGEVIRAPCVLCKGTGKYAWAAGACNQCAGTRRIVSIGHLFGVIDRLVDCPACAIHGTTGRLAEPGAAADGGT